MNSQVKRDDDFTKMCEHCYVMISKYFLFRNACCRRNINYLLDKIGKAMNSLKKDVPVKSCDGAINEPCEIVQISSDEEWRPIAQPVDDDRKPCVLCIEVTDTDTDADVDSDILPLPRARVASRFKRKIKKEIIDDDSNEKFPIKCASRCDEFFANQESMEYHIKTYHHVWKNGKDFQCFVCKRTFATKSYMRQHISRCALPRVSYGSRRHTRRKK